MSLAGGKVLAVHRLFAKASEVKDGASELTVWTFPALELETYTKFKAAVESFKEGAPVAAAEAPKTDDKPLAEGE